ncbi:hypothetical protein [Brevibacillus centrosporus]|uniref:hypothetical protein n=1 Tax=Brevibacillus centrosporus TaxID=54910 RepID=UPI00398787C3
MSFTDLDEQQQANLLFFLDKSDGHELNKMKLKYEVKAGRSLKDFRQNVLDQLMTGCIPFDEFMLWLPNLHLEGNNMLFIYHPKDSLFFEQNPMDKVYQKALSAKEHLYNIRAGDLNKTTLVQVIQDTDKQQIVFSFASPAQIEVKEQESEINSVVLKDDVYLSYVIMDYSLRHFVLLMHPTENLVSIRGEQKKKDWDDLHWILIKDFRTIVCDFELVKPDWLFDALHTMTEEYFHHNNPIISDKVAAFEERRLNNFVKGFLKTDPAFVRDIGYASRIRKALVRTFENELITAYGAKDSSLDFDIFSHKSDKGTTEFKTNSRGKALIFAECGDILRLMRENGEIAALGINYKFEDNGVKKPFPYLISISGRYYSLKRTTTASTAKEVVDGVLRKLNCYKQKVQPSLASAAENE